MSVFHRNLLEEVALHGRALLEVVPLYEGAISDPNAFVLDLVRRSGQIPKPGEIPDYLGSVARIRQSAQALQSWNPRT